MNSDRPKLRQEQAEQAAELPLESQAQTPHEFSSVEEMIRVDAAQNPAPETIAERLKESLEKEPVRQESWWRRLFCR